MDGWKINFLLGRPIFRDYLSFRECSHYKDTKKHPKHSLRECRGTATADSIRQSSVVCSKRFLGVDGKAKKISASDGHVQQDDGDTNGVIYIYIP